MSSRADLLTIFLVEQLTCACLPTNFPFIEHFVDILNQTLVIAPSAEVTVFVATIQNSYLSLSLIDKTMVN